MDNKIYNKKLLFITRIVLFCLGALIGILSIWQFFNANKDFANAGIRSVFYIACGLVPAAVFAFSATIVIEIVSKFNVFLRKKFNAVTVIDISGVMLGIIIGTITGYLCDLLFSLFLNILALRVLIDILVAFFTSYVAIIVCSHLIAERVEADEPPETDRDTFGFLFTADAMSSPVIVSLCENWLIGNKYILAKTVKRLFEELDNEASVSALKNYNTLIDKKAIKVLKADSQPSEWEQILKTSHNRRLKIVALSEEECSSKDSLRPILYINNLTGTARGVND